MELSFARDLLGKTIGVDGYVVMDVNGAVLAQDLGIYANRIKRTEFATWILNCFYAIDSYYPQSCCILLRYTSGHLYLTRTDNQLITVMCRNGADLLSIENAFSKHRQVMAKSDSSGIVREKTKKGETVFLKISETGAGATSSPIPQKKPGPSLGLIIAAVVVLCSIVGAGAFVLGGANNENTPTPVSAASGQPQSEQSVALLPPPESTKNTDALESTAVIARDRAAALAKIASQQNAADLAAMDMARALATGQNALQKFNAKDYDAAVDLWNQSAASYGQAAVIASEANFNTALDQAGLGEIRNYPTSQWIGIESAINEARTTAKAGNFIDAVQSITAQTKKIPEVKQHLITQLSELATQADANSNVPAALDFYQKVVALDPGNEAAKSYIYRNRYHPGELQTNSVGMVLAYIPPGKFNRGSPESEPFRDSDETQALVTITVGFFMDTTEVTQEQWEKVMGQRMRMEDPDQDYIGSTLPMHSITWEQANQFCRRLSELEGKTYRLPTEAEWEYAARADTTTPYNNGKSRLTSHDANIYDPSGEGMEIIAAVGSVGQANAWGLYDMHGNVSEWTADWSAPYSAGPQTDPTGPADNEGRIDLAMKIVRGGSFIDEAHLTRSANRSEASPVVSNSYMGFRPVMILSDL